MKSKGDNMRFVSITKICILFLLALSFLSAQTVIQEGDIEGTWTTADAPYLIEGDLTIPANKTLTIEPGVDVLFQSWYKITINGYIQAQGTESMPIIFTTEDTTTGWVGLRFINAPDSSHLKYCILEFGQATGADPLDKGGAVYISNSNPVIENCTIRKSEADDKGGGIYMENASPRIDYSTVTENLVGYTATSTGGGIYCIDSNPVIRYSHISKNEVYVSGGFSPGRGTGGGIYLNNSDAVLEYNIISENVIDGSGNTGSYARGGAVYATSSDAQFIGNTITGNIAGLDVNGEEQGGILYIASSHPVMVNNILWDNSPQDIYFSDSAIDASVVLAYCDLQGGQSAVVTGSGGTLYWQEGNINSDPLFVDIQEENYHLSAGSPAIDAGTAYYEWNGDVLVNLQSDAYVGSAPDMGALEYNSGDDNNQPPSAIIITDKVEGSAPLTVSFDGTDSYDDDGSISSYYWDFADGTSSTDAQVSHIFPDTGNYFVNLTITDNDGARDRETVRIHVHDGTSIAAGNISGTWQKSKSPYYIEGDVTVPEGSTLTIEPGVKVIFKSWYQFAVNGKLDARGTEQDSIIFTPQDSALGWVGIRFTKSDSSYLAYCLIEEGKATGAEPTDTGGGVYIDSAYVEITNSQILENRAKQSGAGIYMRKSNALIKHTTISRNSNGNYTGSSSGGAIYCTESNSKIIECTIADNELYVSGSFSTAHGSGAGLYLYLSDPEIRNTIFDNNQVNENVESEARGGAIYLYYSDPVIANCTFYGNHAGDAGGAMYLYQSDPNVVNSILWNGSPQEIYCSANGLASNIMVAYSDIEGGQAGIITNDISNIDWREGNINSDPLFSDPAGDDFNLQPFSPCVDAGTDYYEYQGDVLVDIDAADYNGTAPDMGALESGTVSVIDEEMGIAGDFTLHQNYPNPFNPVTNIRFAIPSARHVTLELYSTIGQKIKTLVNEAMPTGVHEVRFNGNDLSSGVYLYRIKAGDFVDTRRMLLIK
ncbi:MAG: PKD domain-containing protein [candidate division Zixibacteria bacterium]|nr:PKD domain-containing protein [candidate division Zixibacteria bacterium]